MSPTIFLMRTCFCSVDWSPGGHIDVRYASAAECCGRLAFREEFERSFNPLLLYSRDGSLSTLGKCAEENPHPRGRARVKTRCDAVDRRQREGSPECRVHGYVYRAQDQRLPLVGVADLVLVR